MTGQLSESQQNYYDALTAEKAREIVRGEKSSDEADALINAILEQDLLHEKQKERFRKDVLKKVAEMKAKAKSEREQNIIREYEGKFLAVDGKMRPAGVQENFRVRVRAGKFEVGNICRKIWGNSIDADHLAKILDEIKQLEEDIEKNKVEIEMLKAAREATATILGSEKFGITFGVTKAGLIKEIYLNKLKAKGWTSIFSTELNLWESYKAARDLKEKNEAEYRREGKKQIAVLEKEEQTLSRRKELLEAALKKVEKMREDGRQLFLKVFGQQLQVLLRNRELMDENDYHERLDEMRKKVREFGKSSGIVNMEYFLNEALGIKPEISSAPTDVVFYKQPRTSLEINEERVRVGKKWKDLFGDDLAEDDISFLIEELRKDDPAFLNDFIADKPSAETVMVCDLFKFLFAGKAPGNAGKEILASSRRLKLSVKEVLDHLQGVKEVAHEYKDKPDELRSIMLTFAEKWPNEYTAEDFEYIHKSVLKETSKKEIEVKRVNEISDLWNKFTGSSVLKLSDADVIANIFQKAYGDDNLGTDVAMEKLAKKPENEIRLINFFFTGQLFDTTLIKDKGLCYDVNADNFLKIYKLVEKLSANFTFDKEKLLKAAKKIVGDGDALKVAGGLPNLTDEQITEMIKDVV